MKETRGLIILQYYTRNATLKQTLRWNLPYDTAPGIGCFRAYRDPTKPPFNPLNVLPGMVGSSQVDKESEDQHLEDAENIAPNDDSEGEVVKRSQVINSKRKGSLPVMKGDLTPRRLTMADASGTQDLLSFGSRRQSMPVTLMSNVKLAAARSPRPSIHSQDALLNNGESEQAILKI